MGCHKLVKEKNVTATGDSVLKDCLGAKSVGAAALGWWCSSDWLSCPGNSMSAGGTCAAAAAGKSWMAWFPTKEAATLSFESINTFSSGRLLW